MLLGSSHQVSLYLAIKEGTSPISAPYVPIKAPPNYMKQSSPALFIALYALLPIALVLGCATFVRVLRRKR